MTELIKRKWTGGSAVWPDRTYKRAGLYSFDGDFSSYFRERLAHDIYEHHTNIWLIEIETNTDDMYSYVIEEDFRDILINHYKSEAWKSPNIIEMAIQGDDKFRGDISKIINTTINHSFDWQVMQGAIYLDEFDHFHTVHHHNWATKIIAGAEWLSGDVGKTIISKAVANNRGTEEEVRAQLRNRIIMQEDPVAIDERNIDRWSPIINYNEVTNDEYYRRSPGFVLPQDRRPATDALLEFNVLDETGLTVQTQYRGETATVEPTGSFWIEGGNILTITATDAAGNLTVKHFANADGRISEALTEIEDEGET